MIEAPTIIMRNKMKKLISAILGVLAFGIVHADDHESNWLVEIGQGVSQTSHLCSFKGKATMADVDKLDSRINKWHENNGTKITRSRLEPLFVGNSSVPFDFVAVDWMTWETFGDAWDKFLASSEGQSIFAASNKILDCSRVTGTVYPVYRNDANATDDQGVVTINWCTKKEGVSEDALLSRHRSYRDTLTSESPVQWWGIGYPSTGARKGQFPGEFFHWNSYADMKGFAQSENNFANNEGWKGRQDYYNSYADCSGQVLMTHTILKRNQ